MGGACFEVSVPPGLTRLATPEPDSRGQDPRDKRSIGYDILLTVEPPARILARGLEGRREGGST